MNLLTTKEASEKLGVHISRVHVLIKEGRLPVHRFGRAYLIEENDLGLVADRPTGRPPKTENDNEAKAKEKSFKTIFDVAPELVGSIKSGLPTDLSSNKDYLKDLGKKSAEKAALQTRKRHLKNNE